eukprot:1585757-Pyramimonas_sp.AAC.2
MQMILPWAEVPPPVKRSCGEVLAERKAALEGGDAMQCLVLQMIHKMDDNTERIQGAIGVQGLESIMFRPRFRSRGLQGQVRAGSVASDASTRPANTRTGGYRAPGGTYFSPSYIELKGWVTDWNDRDRRSQEMLMWDDVKVIIGIITTHCLSEDDRVHVCVDGAERINAGRYMFGSAKSEIQARDG